MWRQHAYVPVYMHVRYTVLAEIAMRVLFSRVAHGSDLPECIDVKVWTPRISKGRNIAHIQLEGKLILNMSGEAKGHTFEGLSMIRATNTQG